MATTSLLSVGHAEIDAQHQGLLLLVADVRRAVEARDLDAARSAVEALWNASVSHFATEDALMEEYAYPERNPHRTAHHLFLEDLKALVRALADDGLTDEVAGWAVQRVPDWMIFHVETNDVPLGRYLARKAAARVLAATRGDLPLDGPPTRRDA